MKTIRLKEIDNPGKGNDWEGFIDRFCETKVLVIGDIIMDEYIWGDVSRISPEAPVPVVEVKRETKMLGGAANVIHNIAALGGKPVLCGVIGDDSTGHEIVAKVKDLGLATDGIFMESERPTSIKTRIVANNQQVVRFDRESIHEIGSDSVNRLLAFIGDTRTDLDAIIVADYGKGVVSADLMKGLRKLVWDSKVVLAVDPKTASVQKRFKSPGFRPAGLAFDGKQLWHVDAKEAKIYRIRPTDGLTTRVIDSPVSQPNALTFDSAALWLSDTKAKTIHRVDPLDGTTIS